MIKSLHALDHLYASTEAQIKHLQNGIFGEGKLEFFHKRISRANQYPLKPNSLEILQINLGYMCNQTCKHCHVDAGPDRKEMMSRDILIKCLEVAVKHNIPTIDITGGAPELHPEFRWFVQKACSSGIKEIIVRSNLTIFSANPRFNDLPEFFKEYNVRVISSLPFYRSSKTDRQRGEGVFKRSIAAIKSLNHVGYGKEGSDLILDLVYNPSGAYLPGDQLELENEYRRVLGEDFGIQFNRLFTITNLPVSRFLDYLIKSENYEEYMEKLVSSFNPAAIGGLMCRNTISVDWQGNLYDCDFNQMLELKVKGTCSHIEQFNISELSKRSIVINQHCYGCTAGSGSSCQGTIT